jgi:hypothetical protein
MVDSVKICVSFSPVAGKTKMQPTVAEIGPGTALVTAFLSVKSCSLSRIYPG